MKPETWWKIKLAGIALAILILIFIFWPAPSIGGDIPPNLAASNLIKTNYKEPSKYSESQTLFTASQNNLNIKSIANTQLVTISPTQLCIGKGDFSRSSEFQLNQAENNVILRYTGNSQKKAKIGIICDDAKSLAADLQNQNINAGEMQCGDGGTSFPNKSETYCVLILRSA